MAIDYYKPHDVVSPKAHVRFISTVFDGGTGTQPFSIAVLEWDGSRCYGIRWNVSEYEWDDPDKMSGSKKCLGLPISHSYPTWFILPDALVTNDVIDRLKETMKGNE